MVNLVRTEEYYEQIYNAKKSICELELYSVVESVNRYLFPCV